MEQQQFRVKFSLGTKLVLSLSLLFVVVVGFLATSAVRLVIEDKKPYVYQLQALDASGASRDFAQKIRLSLDNLRLFLTTFDPRQPITAPQSESLRNLVNNQQEAAAANAFLVTPNGVARYLTGFEHPEGAKLNLQASKLVPEATFFQEHLPRLQKESYSFALHTVPGLPPMLVVLFADVSLKDHPAGMPVALAWLDPARLQIGRRFGELRILGSEGALLYSSDAREVKAPPKFTDHVLYRAALASQYDTEAREYDLTRPDEQGQVTTEKYLGSFQKHPLGTIVISQLPWRKAMAAAYTLGERLTILGFVALGTAILFAIFFSATITRPLKALTRATAQIAKGDFNVDPKVSTRDEVGQLSWAFVSMSKKIQELLVETVKKAHLDEELKVAAAVQESLIPPPEYHDDRIELIGHYQSAAECGGDWWGFFRIGDKVCVMIADATGHGVPSALITASARSCFSVLHKLAKEKAFFRLNPGEMMSYANKVVFDAATTKIMMTFFIGVVDLETGTLTYANAGHNPPWLFKKTGERFQLKSLMPKGNRLGEVEEAPEFEESTIGMEKDDILFLYTDGLLENKNHAGDMYGKKRARQVIEEALSEGPKAIVQRTVDLHLKFNEGKSLDDDITIAVMRIHT